MMILMITWKSAARQKQSVSGRELGVGTNVVSGEQLIKMQWNVVAMPEKMKWYNNKISRKSEENCQTAITIT